MAAVTDGASLSAILATLYNDQVRAQMNRTCVLAQALPIRVGTGKNIAWDVAFTGSYTNGPAADGADVAAYNSDTKLPAVLPYCTYFEAVAIGGRAQAAASASGNPVTLANLVGYEINEAARRLAGVIASHFYVGTGASNQLQGLYSTTGTTYGALVATGTYAGIDRSSYSEWACNVSSNGGVARALTLDLMRDVRRLIYTACGEKPDLIVTDPIQFERLGQLLGPYRTMKQEVTIRGQKIVLDGGFAALEFDGIPVLEDAYHPAGKMSFLNTNYAYISQLPYTDEDATEIGIAGDPDEQFGEGAQKLSAKLVPLARTGDARKIELVCYLQIVVEKPCACGALIDLAS